MSKRGERTSLSGYFAEISRRLQAQAAVLSPVVPHYGQMGDNDHLWFADLVRQYLPGRFGIDTGFVVNSSCGKEVPSTPERSFEDGPRIKETHISPQIDMLLLDTFENAPLHSEKAFRVCPVEMVLGAAEVTRNLTRKKLRTDLRKLAHVRGLADPKLLKFRGKGVRGLRPKAFIIGLKGDVKDKDIKAEVAEIPDELRPNVIAILDRAIYIRRPETIEFAKATDDVLFRCLATIRQAVEIHPVGRADLNAYLPPSFESI